MTRDMHAEVEARRERLARLEQERADLQIEIEAFRQMYLARVGPAQSELQALDLHIAEYRLRNELIRLRGASLDAAKLEAEVDWQLRGRRAEFSGYRDRVHQAERDKPAAAPSLDPSDQADLKALYRDLAKRVHPDLALDDSDRLARSALMAEINAAYAQADLAALKANLARLDDPARVEPAQTADRLSAELERLDRAMTSTRAEIAELNQSDWMAMKLDAALARSRGIDWFARARRQIEAQAADRREELDTLIAEFKQLVHAAGLV